MKNLLLAMLVTASASAAGRVVDETRQVGEFTGVHVGSAIQAKVETGAAGPIVLRGEEAVLKRVRTEVKGSQLHIMLEPDTSVSSDAPISVTIRMPRATSLGTSGGSQMEATVPAGESLEVHASGGSKLQLKNAVKPKRLELNASGASTVTLAGVESGDMEFHLSGRSRATLSGRANSASASLSGGAQLNAAGLEVGTLAVDASGSARAEVRATKSVSGTLSGGSQVRVPASADVRVEASGRASVVRDL